MPAIAPPDRTGDEGLEEAVVEIEAGAGDVIDPSNPVDAVVTAAVVETGFELAELEVLVVLDNVARSSDSNDAERIWQRTKVSVKLYPGEQVVDRGQQAWLTPAASLKHGTEPA